MSDYKGIKYRISSWDETYINPYEPVFKGNIPTILILFGNTNDLHDFISNNFKYKPMNWGRSYHLIPYYDDNIEYIANLHNDNNSINKIHGARYNEFIVIPPVDENTIARILENNIIRNKIYHDTSGSFYQKHDKLIYGRSASYHYEPYWDKETLVEVLLRNRAAQDAEYRARTTEQYRQRAEKNRMVPEIGTRTGRRSSIRDWQWIK